jgi:hypothetical protein
MRRALCILSALVIGTVVPVLVAFGDKMIRDPLSNGLAGAVLLILGTASAALVSLLVLWPLSALYKPNSIQRVFMLTLLATAAWAAIAFILFYIGPYSMQFTTRAAVRYLTIAGYGIVGAFAFFMTLFLCRTRLDRTH